jgi:hypothetical protein
MLVSEIARGISPIGPMSPKKMRRLGEQLVAVADFLIGKEKKKPGKFEQYVADARAAE